MKYLLFLAVWRRPEITEICFKGINRLRESKDVGVFAVISEDSMIPLCRKYDIDFCMHENKPLGRKKNYGLTQAMQLKWDYLVELGSDDLIKDKAFDYYDDSEIQCLNSVAFVDSITGACRKYSTGTFFGLGRKIRRDVIDRTGRGVEVIAKESLISPGRNTIKGQKGFFPIKDAEQLQRVGMAEIVSDEVYKLWKDQQDRGMDNQSMYFMNKFGAKGKMTQVENPVLIDIKSDENIWPYNPTLGTEYTMKEVMDGLSQDEQSALVALIKRNRCIETQVIR